MACIDFFDFGHYFNVAFVCFLNATEEVRILTQDLCSIVFTFICYIYTLLFTFTHFSFEMWVYALLFDGGLLKHGEQDGELYLKIGITLLWTPSQMGVECLSKSSSTDMPWDESQSQLEIEP